MHAWQIGQNAPLQAISESPDSEINNTLNDNLQCIYSLRSKVCSLIHVTEPKESNRNKCERGWGIASLETQAWLMESKSQNSLLNRHDEFS